jgi:hypothetical protein
MYSQTTQLPYILNYERARTHFNNTKKPPRSKKWADNERPLKNAAAHHYRIVRDEDNDCDWYDIVLYQTTMARFYKPTAEGHERRLYMGNSSRTSLSFMADVLSMYWVTHLPVQPVENLHRQLRELDKKVAVFVGVGRPLDKDKGMPYSADLWFDANGVLLVDKSSALTAWRRVSTNDNLLERKRLRQLMEGYATLMALRLPEFLNENTKLSRQDTYAFSRVDSDNRRLRDFVHVVVNGEQPSEAHINALVDYTANAVASLAAKRADKIVQLGWHPSSIKVFSNLRVDDLKISEKDVISLVTNKLLRVCGAMQQSGRVEYPSFRPSEDLPRSNLFV